MLTQYIVEQQAQNRRAERNPIPLQTLLTRINQEDYENLIQWVFENSEVLGLNCSTKFLARTFFDASILDSQIIPYNQNIALALAALALAIKFNESRQLSEQLTLQTLLNMVDIRLSMAEYVCLETKVMRSVSFVFRYTSPIDYLDGFMERFPFFPKFKKVIPKFIELALMRPLACQFTAEEIFYGTVLALIELHKTTMDQFQTRLLFSMTDTWEKAKGVAAIINESFAIAQQA